MNNPTLPRDVLKDLKTIHDLREESIPYIEKEYGLTLLRKSRKASRRARGEDRMPDEIAA